LPSHQENFGIAVAEALSSNTPVIITNKVNIFKTIKNNSAGIVTNDNIISFSSGLKEFLQLNKYEYQKYSVNSFKCFLENYQIEPVAKNLAKYIKKYLNKYDNNKK
jgi:glycosyltransferase involved in cell wall biosynthesis